MSAEERPEDEALALRLLAGTAWRHRRTLAGLGATVLALAIGLAAILGDRYTSHSTLLLLLGPEYAVQEPAGAPTAPNTTLDPDRILGTEDAILGSVALHRATIAEIGIARLYPELLGPPRGFRRLVAAIRGVPGTISRLLGDARGHGAADPADLALAAFDAHFTSRPSRTASIIVLGFSHRDPAVARDTLAALERLYLERRRALYAARQTPVLARELGDARRSLDEAAAALARFRAGRTLPDYATQLTIALHAEGDAAADAANARRALATARARRESFVHAMSRLAPIVSGGVDLDRETETGALRTTVEDFRAQEAQALGRYRPDSAFARALHDTATRRARDLAAANRAPVLPTEHTVRNPAFDNAVAGYVAANADAAAAEARLAADIAEDDRLRAGIHAIDADSRTMESLTRERDMRLDAWRRLASLAAAEAGAEEVAAGAVPSVRIAADPELPLHPSPRRLLVLLAGLAGACACPAAAALVLNAARRTVSLAAEIDRLGVPVLAELSPGDPFAALGPIVPIARPGPPGRPAPKRPRA